MTNAATWYKTVLDYWESPRIRYLSGPVELTWRKTLDAMFRWGDGGSYEIDLAQFAGIVKAASVDAALEHAEILHFAGCGDWTALLADGTPVPWSRHAAGADPPRHVAEPARRGHAAGAPVSRLRIFSGFVADQMEKLNADRNRKRRTDGTPPARRGHAAGADPPRHVAEPARRRDVRVEESRGEEKQIEPVVPGVTRIPSPPATPGTAGPTGSSAPPPLNGHSRNGDVALGRARSGDDGPAVGEGAASAPAANGGAATAVLAEEPGPTSGGRSPDPTSIPSILRGLAAEDLDDPKRFEPFFHRLRRAGKAPIPERQLVSHFALALECRRVARNPVGLFIARVEEGDWSKMKPDDFAAAELALGRRDVSSTAEQARRDEAAESRLGLRLPKDLPRELRDRLHAAKPGSRDFLDASNAVAAWTHEHEPGPRRVDPDAAGVSVAAFVERLRSRNADIDDAP